MSIHVALNHVTQYRYDRLVSLSPQIVRLRPAPHSRTPILSYSLTVTPAEHFINWQQDPQSNYLARLVFPEKTREFRVEVDLVAEMSVINPFAIGYVIRMEPGIQTPEETLTKATGSCRDSAWLLVQLLRHLGLAARFVSGYLIQLTPDVKSLDGPSGTTYDFTDLHAWCEVYLPGAGWVGLDPTSGLFAGEGHIPVACSPDPSSAAPITGFSDKAECEFEHTMKVERVWEAPRVTKPYTEAQWQDIADLGHRIDSDLAASDVRLTMGGEPTFISIDDPDGAEWNTDALGPTKRIRAADLFHRLRDHYAPKGLAHFGQGKWYPGEQLPRWSLDCYWRRDGQPIWADPALYADETRDYGADADLAGRFLRGVAQRLTLDPKYVFPAFEDAFYYLWRERRLARVFTQGLDAVVGHVLPVARNYATGAWQTGPWFLRSERCYLIPGDSPLGYRLPLDSQPWVTTGEYPYINEADPAQPPAALASYTTIRRQVASGPGGGPSGEPLAARSGMPTPDVAAGNGCAGIRPRRDDGFGHSACRRALAQGVPIRRLDHSHRNGGAGAQRRAVRVHATNLEPGRLPRTRRRGRSHRGRSRKPGDPRGLPPAVRSATRSFQRDARPGRHRSQHPALRELGRDGRAHRASLRSGAALTPHQRKVHARRSAHRNRRRQSHGAGRAHAA